MSFPKGEVPYYENRNIFCLLGREWDVDFFPYVQKVKDLGFDILEISGGGLAEMPDEKSNCFKRRSKTVWNYAHRLHRSAG